MAKKITEAIKIDSSHFGELEIHPENVFYFENGLLGFEMLNNFVLITDDEIVPFKWLMSVEEPTIMFPLISPWLVDANYDAGPDVNIENQVVFSVVTLNDGNGNITANLKAPVVLDSSNLTGLQLILPFEKYSVCQKINQTK
jgi:flagellar assembly factor FliW